ncbi:hypothetical protein MD484_g7623, partial [Candolleomyces efflorescens]
MSASTSGTGSGSGSQKNATGPGSSNAEPSSPKKNPSRPKPKPRRNIRHTGRTEQDVRGQNSVHWPDMTIDNYLENSGSLTVEGRMVTNDVNPRPRPRPRAGATAPPPPGVQSILRHDPTMSATSVEELYAKLPGTRPTGTSTSDATAPSAEAPQASVDPLAGFDTTWSGEVPQPWIGPLSEPIADPSLDAFDSQALLEGFDPTFEFTSEDWGDIFNFELAEADGLVAPTPEAAATSSELPVDDQPAAASGSTDLLQVTEAAEPSTSTSSNAVDPVQDPQTEGLENLVLPAPVAVPETNFDGVIQPSPSPLAHRTGTMFFYDMTTGMPGLPGDEVGVAENTAQVAAQNPAPLVANAGSTSGTLNGPVRGANLAAAPVPSMLNVQVASQVANAPTSVGIVHPQTTQVLSQVTTNNSTSASAVAQPSPWVPMTPEEWGGISAALLNVTGQPFIPPSLNAGNSAPPQIQATSSGSHMTNAVHFGPQTTPSLQTLPRNSAPVNVSTSSGMTRSAKLEVMEAAIPSNPSTSFTPNMPPTNINAQLRQSVPPQQYQQAAATGPMTHLANGSVPTYSAAPSTQPAQATTGTNSQSLPGDLTNEINQALRMLSPEALRLLPTVMQMATKINVQGQSQQYNGPQANNVHLQAPMHSLNGSAPYVSSTNQGMHAPQANNVHLQAPMHSLNGSAPNGISTNYYGAPVPQPNHVQLQAPMHSLNGSAANVNSTNYGVPASRVNGAQLQAPMHSLNSSAPSGASTSYGMPATQVSNARPQAPTQPMMASAPNGTSTNHGMLAPTLLISQPPVPLNGTQQYPSHQQLQRSGSLPPPTAATPAPTQSSNAASNNVQVTQGPNSTNYQTQYMTMREWVLHAPQAPGHPAGSWRDSLVDVRIVQQMMAMGQIIPLAPPVQGHTPQQGAAAAAPVSYAPSPALSTATAAPSGHRPTPQVQYQTAAVHPNIRAPTGVAQQVPLGPSSILNTPFVPVTQAAANHQAQTRMAQTMAQNAGNVQQGQPVRSIPRNSNGYPRAGSSQLLNHRPEEDGQRAAQQYAAQVQQYNRLVQETENPENGGQPQGNVATSSLGRSLKRGQEEFEDQDGGAGNRPQ